MTPTDYVDQDGNVVPICVACEHWRATVGDLCEACAYIAYWCRTDS